MKNKNATFRLKKILNRANSFIVILEKEFGINKNKSHCINLYITVYKLSSVSCFFNLETEIPFHVEGKYFVCLSGYHQMILRTIKKSLESFICSNEE